MFKDQRLKSNPGLHLELRLIFVLFQLLTRQSGKVRVPPDILSFYFFCKITKLCKKKFLSGKKLFLSASYKGPEMRSNSDLEMEQFGPNFFFAFNKVILQRQKF